MDNKTKNIWILLTGYSLFYLVFAVVSFFLPFFLKEQGLEIVKIGAVLTIGLAVGSLFVSLVYSRLLRFIKIKTGLIISSIIGFFGLIILFFLPSSLGVTLNNFSNSLKNSLSHVSQDAGFQHNVDRRRIRKYTNLNFILTSFGQLVGIFLAIISIIYLGFRVSFLIFSLISLVSILIYLGFDDSTRFKLSKNKRLPRMSGRLKLILFAEWIYWFAMASSFSLVITFLVTDYLSGGLMDIGIAFGFLYSSLVISGLIFGKFLENKNDFKTGIFGMSIILLGAILIILFRNIYILFFALALEGIGASIWGPSKHALYCKFTEKENREVVSGYSNGVRDFLQSLGPLFGGILVVSFGITMPFVFKAVVCLISIGIYGYLYNKSNQT